MCTHSKKVCTFSLLLCFTQRLIHLTLSLADSRAWGSPLGLPFGPLQVQGFCGLASRMCAQRDLFQPRVYSNAFVVVALYGRNCRQAKCEVQCASDSCLRNGARANSHSTPPHRALRGRLYARLQRGMSAQLERHGRW